MNADINPVPQFQETWEDHCAYCGAGIDEVQCSIHRDGMREGPEVPLCEKCGTDPYPTLDEIWAKIANPEPLIEAIKNEMRKVRKE